MLSAVSGAASTPALPEITPELCAHIVDHVATDAAYKAEVDARGNAVVSADLGGGSPSSVPESYSYNLNLLGDDSPLAGVAGLGGSEGSLGNVAYDSKSGIVSYNGQELTKVTSAEIHQKCLDLMQKPKVPPTEQGTE